MGPASRARGALLNLGRAATRAVLMTALISSACAGSADEKAQVPAGAPSTAPLSTLPAVKPMSPDEFVAQLCAGDGTTPRIVWALPALIGSPDPVGVGERARLAPGCTNVVVNGGLAGSAHEPWVSVTVGTATGWAVIDCDEFQQPAVHDAGASAQRCTDYIRTLQKTEAQPLDATGLADLVLESVPFTPKAGERCGNTGGAAGWKGYLANRGSAASARDVAYSVASGDPLVDAGDSPADAGGSPLEFVRYSNRGLEPGERLELRDFRQRETVTLDIKGETQESNESNNTTTLGTLPDTGLTCRP